MSPPKNLKTGSINLRLPHLIVLILLINYHFEGWTRFVFPGRAGKYSQFEWYHQHFTAVDFDQMTGNKGFSKFLVK